LEQDFISEQMRQLRGYGLQVPTTSGGKLPVLPATAFWSNGVSVEEVMKQACVSGQATFKKPPQIIFVLLPSECELFDPPIPPLILLCCLVW